jgi:hypothetical protein
MGSHDGYRQLVAAMFSLRHDPQIHGHLLSSVQTIASISAHVPVSDPTHAAHASRSPVLCTQNERIVISSSQMLVDGGVTGV